MLFESIKPSEAYSLFELRILSSDEIVTLAHSWLENGVFTDSLNDLCWETNPVMSSVGPMFEKAMAELGSEKPTQLEAARNVVRETLKRVLTSEILPDEVASFLYWEVHSGITAEWPDKEYVGDNLGLQYIFCWLREIWDCRDGSILQYYANLPRHEAEEKFKEHLIDEAHKWLNNAT